MIEIPEGYVIVRTIVRCKDCKYWYNDEYETEGYCDLTKYFHMTADDFCSKGEKKDDRP